MSVNQRELPDDPAEATLEMKYALGVRYDEIVMMPPHAGKYFNHVNGTLTFIGTRDDAKKFVVLRDG